MMGRPLIELPPVQAKTTRISFSREERAIYRMLEDRFRENMNYHLKKGTAQGNYNNFMVQLLRLRQCTAHPFLLESTIRDILTPEDLKSLKNNLWDLSKSKQPLYEQIQQWVQEGSAWRERPRDPDESETQEVQISGGMPFGRSEFGKSFDMNRYLDAIDGPELMENVICKLCGDQPTNAQITNVSVRSLRDFTANDRKCNHIFCGECIANLLHREAAKDEVHHVGLFFPI
jgi:hypothetical protein